MAETFVAEAQGRVNLIGEHTDYQDGYVLPTVIPQKTTVHLEPRPDRHVRARSTTLGTGWETYEIGSEQPGRGWLDYVQGVTNMLEVHGVVLHGFDATVHSTIPVGGGLSSSAALEVGLLRALRAMLSITLDDMTVAKIAQAAECEFVGAPTGIMDQVACSLGRSGEALFLDTRTLQMERVPIPPAIDLLVIDSGIPHHHSGGAYGVRRRESFEAAALLGVERLRDVEPHMRMAVAGLPPLLRRRARHIISENQRVLQAVAALRDGDARRLGTLFDASHASMRDDYEVSTPEIDDLVRIAQQHKEVYGARLTGGGFGGSVVVIARAGMGRTAGLEICARYQKRSGLRPVLLVPS